jgi:hypothetical protein
VPNPHWWSKPPSRKFFPLFLGEPREEHFDILRPIIEDTDGILQSENPLILTGKLRQQSGLFSSQRKVFSLLIEGITLEVRGYLTFKFLSSTP